MIHFSSKLFLFLGFNNFLAVLLKSSRSHCNVSDLPRWGKDIKLINSLKKFFLLSKIRFPQFKEEKLQQSWSCKYK